MPVPSEVLPLNVYYALYSFLMEYGIWYAMSLILAIIIYFHALFTGIEPPLVWAFITFAFPVAGALLYLIYFICFWKNYCVSRKEREKAREILKKWEDTPSTLESEAERDMDYGAHRDSTDHGMRSERRKGEAERKMFKSAGKKSTDERDLSPYRKK